MPAATQEQQVAALVNSMLNMILQLNGQNGVLAQIQQINSQWTNLSAANKLNAFPTASATATGGIGVADATPNVANLIDTRTGIGGELQRAVSANNVAGLLTYLNGVAAVMSGSAVAANGAAVQLVALCL